MFYEPGDQIGVEILIENRSNSHIKRVAMSLNQVINLKCENQRDSEESFFGERTRKLSIGPGDNGNLGNPDYPIRIKVPNNICPSMRYHELMSVYYYLKIELFGGVFSQLLSKLKIPINIESSAAHSNSAYIDARAEIRSEPLNAMSAEVNANDLPSYDTLYPSPQASAPSFEIINSCPALQHEQMYQTI